MYDKPNPIYKRSIIKGCLHLSRLWAKPQYRLLSLNRTVITPLGIVYPSFSSLVQ